MDETEFYELRQITDYSFSYDMALSDRDILCDWIEENFEAEEYHFYDTTFGTHASTVYVRFSNIETALAFKLRWT